MSRRTAASLVAVGLIAVVLGGIWLLPVPYVTMSPGPTVDVLGESAGKPIVQVTGHPTYPTKGELRLTTVTLTNPDRDVHLAEVISDWLDRDNAIYAFKVMYPDGQTAEDERAESAVQMVSSQDAAVAAALIELGFEPKPYVEVLGTSPSTPAAGKLLPRDEILLLDGTRIDRPQQVYDRVQAAGVGARIDLVVRRGGERKQVTLTAVEDPDNPGRPVVGVVIGTGYHFPFQVSVNLDEAIGGPSAGLMFSLAIYDTLTPGALTGGDKIAGTGTITEDGLVGPIGGIQQKIVAAADAGARVFLVPPDNCEAALGAHVEKDEIRLVRAETLHSAVASVEKYAEDPDSDLPSCAS